MKPQRLVDAVQRNSNSMAIGGDQRISIPGVGQDASVFTFTINRATAAIAAAVPVPLFAPINDYGSYRKFVAPVLPPSTVISEFNGFSYNETSALKLAGNQVVEYTEGANVDTVTVSCTNVPYQQFNAGLLTDKMQLTAIKITVPAAQLQQLDQAIHFIKQSPYGAGKYDSITPSVFLSPNQYQVNQVMIGGTQFAELNIDIPVLDRQSGIAVMMDNVAGLEVSLSIYVSGSYRN